ncbi:MAG: guanylate kinase [Verrucomicrobia bacterium]|nr:guanylate kinase [Cytophagales bacterium]
MFDGKLLIFSAPSGSGKTTIVQHLLACNPNLGFSISACTRKPRSNETHGKDYYFLSKKQFEQKVAENEFAEWEEVYPGRFYGTLKSEIERLWSLKKHVIFDVDVGGGMTLKNNFNEKALAIFVKVPSFEVLENRLRSRGTETEESLQSRLEKVRYEMTFEENFDKVLLNAELQITLDQAQQLIDDFIN